MGMIWCSRLIHRCIKFHLAHSTGEELSYLVNRAHNLHSTACKKQYWIGNTLNSVISVSITGGTINGFILQAKQKSGAGIGSFDKNSMPAGTQRGPCIAEE